MPAQIARIRIAGDDAARSTPVAGGSVCRILADPDYSA
jgi:hypothetical protein